MLSGALNPLSKLYLVNFTGLVGIVNTTVYKTQGRIQDLKLGVAQIDWKICIISLKYDYLYFYIINTIYFKYAFKYHILYLKPLYLYNIAIKNRIWNFFRGGARPVRPPLNPPLRPGQFSQVSDRHGKCF